MGRKSRGPRGPSDEEDLGKKRRDESLRKSRRCRGSDRAWLKESARIDVKPSARARSLRAAGVMPSGPGDRTQARREIAARTSWWEMGVKAGVGRGEKIDVGGERGPEAAATGEPKGSDAACHSSASTRSHSLRSFAPSCSDRSIWREARSCSCASSACREMRRGVGARILDHSRLIVTTSGVAALVVAGDESPPSERRTRRRERANEATRGEREAARSDAAAGFKMSLRSSRSCSPLAAWTAAMKAARVSAARRLSSPTMRLLRDEGRAAARRRARCRRLDAV